MPVTALEHIRRMRGGAQSHLMRCSDGNLYVVKFQNNPQGLRVLVNEMLATRLAEAIGLPVCSTEVVDVDRSLIERDPQLNVQLVNHSVRCAPGLQFGSRYATDPTRGEVFDYLPAEMLSRVRNIGDFAGILAVDKWTGNADGRQAAFCRKLRERNYNAVFIDQGYCFNAGEWTFPDFPLRGLFAQNEVYQAVTGWGAFEPWLSRIETFSRHEMWHIASEIPTEWYRGERAALDTLVENLIHRRTMVRGLIELVKESPRRPFPHWLETKSVGA